MRAEPWRTVRATVAAVGMSLLLGCKPAAAPQGEAATDVAVQVGKVTRTTLRSFVEAYGVVEPEPARASQPAGSASLSAPSAGIVMAVPVSEGDRVRIGTVVVRLDDRVARAAVDKASNAVDYAEAQMSRQNKLAEMADTSEKAVQGARQQLAAARADLAAAQAQLALVQLASPLDGVVSRINVRPGQAVDLNTVVADVVDPGRLIVTANAPAAEAETIREGQGVEVMPAGDSRAMARGRVLFLSPQVDPKTGTVMVRIALPPDAGLSPGRFVQARIVTQEHRDRLAVPVASVYTDHDGQSTLSVVQGDTAIQRVVKTGLRDHGLIEVEGKGLAEGMTVVTLGSYALPKETKIRVVASPEEVK